MSATTLLLLLLAAGAAPTSRPAVPLRPDDPPAPQPKAGTISGVIGPARQVTRVWAVSRDAGQVIRPSTWDRDTGRFTFAKLRGDATYDVCCETVDGRTYEGVDLSPPDARLLRLAALRRKALGLPAERSHEFGSDDVKALQDFLKDMKGFMEIRRALYIQGHGIRATVLVELMRTRQFHASGGTVIWRVELWYFKNQFGGWERLTNQENLLRRVRTTPRTFQRIHVEYDPRLSVYIDPAGHSRTVAYTLPDRPDASRGRLPNTAPEQNTKTHVFLTDTARKKYIAGGGGPSTRPTTAPAARKPTQR